MKSSLFTLCTVLTPFSYVNDDCAVAALYMRFTKVYIMIKSETFVALSNLSFGVVQFAVKDLCFSE